jgi:SAM-dependent methyltransferase
MVLDTRTPLRPDAAIWHEVECASYREDLPLWDELADAHTGTQILDVGAGGGRVALHLARRGHEVIALDNDPVLLEDLRARAGDLQIQTVCADARDFTLPDGAQVGLCIAPMQTVQLLAGPSGRIEFLRRVREHLLPGGLLAVAIVCELEQFDCRDGGPQPTPDVLSVNEALYRSQPVRVAVQDRGIVIERRRAIIAPARHDEQLDVIRLDRCSSEHLAVEAANAGLAMEGVRVIAASSEHVGSSVVMLRG